MALSLGRRLYYLFFAEFRWIGTLVLLYSWRRARQFRSEAWHIALLVTAANLALVCVLGGAELERYLLPVLPIFYIAVGVGATYLPRRLRAISAAGLLIGLFISLFWNPRYPFPYENNFAMVDFVRLQEAAAGYSEQHLQDRTIATAWPYTAALVNPDYGFVKQKLRVVETNDFHVSSIRSLPPGRFDALITYTRTWAPENGVISNSVVRRFLGRFYDWAPDITADECVQLGLTPVMKWEMRGQEIAIYVRQ
jgi:hypothetical protein